MKPQILNMDSEPMAEFKATMNYAIKTAIDQLTSKGLTQGDVSAKIRITIEEHEDQETGDVIIMPILEPEVSLKIGAKGKMECGKQQGMILRKSPCGTPVVASNQISFDDLMEAERGA